MALASNTVFGLTDKITFTVTTNAAKSGAGVSIIARNANAALIPTPIESLLGVGRHIKKVTDYTQALTYAGATGAQGLSYELVAFGFDPIKVVPQAYSITHGNTANGRTLGLEAVVGSRNIIYSDGSGNATLRLSLCGSDSAEADSEDYCINYFARLFYVKDNVQGGQNMAFNKGRATFTFDANDVALVVATSSIGFLRKEGGGYLDEEEARSLTNDIAFTETVDLTFTTK